MLTLIRGLPGSGKSSYAKSIVLGASQITAHLEADMYHMVRGVYQFDPNNVKAAHEWCFNATKVLLNSGVQVVVSNTFTMLWEMQRYLDLAQELGTWCVVYRCTGKYGNVHDVPADVLAKMAERFESYPGEWIV